MTPLASVITASHAPNRDYLIAAYESLRVQSLTAWEWCLTLDGGDELLSSVPKAIKKDPRVVLSVNGQRLGAGNSRNIALVRSRGTVVVNLDADDTFTEGALDALSAPILRNDNVGVVFGRNLELHASGIVKPSSPDESNPLFPTDFRLGILAAGYLPDLWLRTSHHFTSTSHAAYRRSTGLAVGGWGALQRSQDLYLLLMAADITDAYFVNDVVGHYRIHEGQTTNTTNTEPEQLGREFIASYLLNARAARGIAVEQPGYADRSGRWHDVRLDPPARTTRQEGIGL